MLKILGRANSANVQKVLWGCAELGLPFEREDVGGPFGRNREPAYLALNPNGLVPTIVDDGAVIWESNTILRYLAANNGSEALYPSRPSARAVCEQWMDWQLSVLGPAITPLFIALVRTPAEQRDPKATEAARDRTSAAVAILDGWLGKHPFLGGDRFTIADIPAGIMVYRWFALDIRREDYANLKAWHDRLSERDGFRKYVAVGLT